MKISLFGCGWFGAELALHLPGHELFGTTTTAAKLPILKSLGLTPWLFHGGNPPTEILNADIIILNIPPHPGQLAEFKSWNWNKAAWIIFISSTSVYGQEGVLNETTIPLPASENGQLLLEEEKWVQSSFQHWTVLRFAGLLGKERHPGKYLSGRESITGKNWPVNLLHLDDAVGFTKSIIQQRIQNKIYNVVSDEHTTKEEFYTEFAQRKNLALPGFDQNDKTTGKIIENVELKKIYTLKRPRMIGTDF